MNTLEKKYICKYCGKTIKRKCDFIRHIKKCEINHTPYNCKKCGKLVTIKFGSGIFCSQSCANTRYPEKDTKTKTSCSLKKYYLTKQKYKYICEKCNKEFYRFYKFKENRKIRCDECKRKVKHSNNNFNNIKELSKRTISKIFKRLKIKCSICGWNKATCDIHHILPRKSGGTDDNSNLVILCPNCHRMVHNHSDEITKEMLLNNSLDKIIEQIKEAYHPCN